MNKFKLKDANGSLFITIMRDEDLCLYPGLFYGKPLNVLRSNVIVVVHGVEDIKGKPSLTGCIRIPIIEDEKYLHRKELHAEITYKRMQNEKGVNNPEDLHEFAKNIFKAFLKPYSSLTQKSLDNIRKTYDHYYGRTKVITLQEFYDLHHEDLKQFLANTNEIFDNLIHKVIKENMPI